VNVCVANPVGSTVPEFIDPVFAKTSPKRPFPMIENERFGGILVLLAHRVGRVLCFFSSRRNWDSPTPHPQACVPTHPLVRLGDGGGRAHSLAGEGLGESQFRRGEILCALYEYI
jgi:hypothetical protein